MDTTDLRQMAAKFSDSELAPLAEGIDRQSEIPQDIYDKVAANGFFGTFIPEEYGGAGMDYLSYAIIVEELSRGCGSTGVLVSAHCSLCVWPIMAFGSAAQKQSYLPRLASGEVGCFMLSEPGAGSDAGGLRCFAEDKGDHFLVNGVKNWITNGKQAKIGILLAKTEKTDDHRGVSAFIVEMGTPGIEVQKCEEKLGIKGSSTAQIVFENVKIPKDNMLEKKGKGFKVAMMTLDGGRIGIAAQALGIGRAAFDYAKKYCGERVAFGQQIGKFQAVQLKIADMSTRLSASWLLIEQASCLKNAKAAYTKEAAQAKLFASEACTFVTKEAVQILGGNGYSKEYPVERFFRDAKITEIYEGTSEIQRLVIAGQELKGVLS